MREILETIRQEAAREINWKRKTLLLTIAGAFDRLFREVGEHRLLGPPPIPKLPPDAFEVMRALQPDTDRGNTRWNEGMRLIMLAALKECGQSKTLAAQWMGIHRQTFYNWGRKFKVW